MIKKIRTPADKRVKVNMEGSEVEAVLQWRKDFSTRRTAGFQAAQVYVDSEVIRLSDPLTPMRTGTLKKSGLMATVTGSGTVTYNAPHARYQYYGKVMVGRAPKRLTNKDLTYEGAPQRGAKWFERMKAQNRNEILKGAAKIAAGKK